jgi:hypothetical protein
MADGYQVDPSALGAVARGINDVIAELDTVGGVATGGMGRGFTGVTPDPGQLGHGGAHSALAEFCLRWGVAVRGLVEQGNDIAGRLDLSAGAYHDHERYLAGVLKSVSFAAVGDPHATRPAEDRDWSELGDEAGTLLHPDISPRTMPDAQRRSSDALSEEWGDARSQGGRVGRALGGLTAPDDPPPAGEGQ